MGRIRTIKPEFTQHEELSSLPAETHLLAAGLLCYSDDDGYFNANQRLVKAAIFPVRETSVSIRDMLLQLAGIGFVRLGIADNGKNYGQVVKFREHQRVNRPTPSKIKDLRVTWNDSVSGHGVLREDSLPERKGMEGKGNERKGREDNGDTGKPVHEVAVAGIPKEGIVEIPVWVPSDNWQRFLDMRRAIKAPLTKAATQLIIGKLEKLRSEGYDPATVLDESVCNNWKSVFPLRSKRNDLINRAEERQRTNLVACAKAKAAIAKPAETAEKPLLAVAAAGGVQ